MMWWQAAICVTTVIVFAVFFIIGLCIAEDQNDLWPWGVLVLSFVGYVFLLFALLDYWGEDF